jgi:hypothetical protein
MRPRRLRPRLRPTIAFLLLLVPDPGWAGSPGSSEEDATLRSEWEKVLANQQRAIRDNDKRLAEIYARDGGTDETRRAEKITRDRVAASSSALKGGGKGQILAQMAATTGGDASGLAELSRTQAEYVGGEIREWADGPERTAVQEAATLLQRNLERTRANLVRATEAADAMTTRLPHSHVLEKVGRIAAAAKEAGARLAARWELERAARERAREQREREAGERAREQRR